MYLVISEVAMSVVLFREENKKQRPVFYVSRILLDVETPLQCNRKDGVSFGEYKEEAAPLF